MSDSCNCIDIKVEVMMDEPEINCEVDVSEVILCSDGEDYKRGYEEGHAEGYTTGQADGYESGYDEGYEKGYSKKVDYLPYISSVVFSSSSGISEITDDIYLDLSNATILNTLFRSITLNCEKVTVKLSNKCTSLQWAFAGSLSVEKLKTIELLGDTSSVTYFANTFRNRKNLESIIGDFDCSSVTSFSDMFMNVYTIKEFFPKAGTIKVSISFSNQANLTDESIQAIIDGLADLTGSDTQTITFHANVKAKLTEEQIATITSKNWTLA